MCELCAGIEKTHMELKKQEDSQWCGENIEIWKENNQAYLGYEGSAFPISFCPYCNQRLTLEEPLTVEELKQMDGEPVWVVDTIHDHGSGYYLVNLNYKFALDIPGAVWPVIIDKDGWFFKFCNLGDGIAVYRHKPMEKEEGS